VLSSIPAVVVPLPPKKRQRPLPEYTPDFTGVDLKVHTYSNYGGKTIEKVLDGYHVAPGIVDDLKALEFDDSLKVREGESGIVPNQKTRVVLLYSDDEYSVVQLSFATDFVFTMKFSKKGRNKEHCFTDPCLYMGYPLKVDKQGIDFPTFSLVDGGATWLSAYFGDREDVGSKLDFTIDFGNFDDIRCMMDVSLDGVLDVIYRHLADVKVDIQWKSYGQVLDDYKLPDTLSATFPNHNLNALTKIDLRDETENEWVVELSFDCGELWSFSLKIPKAHAKKKHVLAFTHPCLHGNDSFTVSLFRVDFAWHHVIGDASWEYAEINFETMSMSIVLKGCKKDFACRLGEIYVPLDGIIEVLRKME
jgi:hypothetical protein